MINILWEISIKKYPYLVQRQTILRERRSLNFIKIFNTLHLKGIYGIKSTGSILGLWELLTKEHTIIRKCCSLNFINMSHRLSDIFGNRSSAFIEVHILGIWGFE